MVCSDEIACNDIIYVDDSGGADYLTIQEAINAASNDDTIFVYAGYYKETILIEKPLTVIGEDREHTIINGGKENDVVTISSEGVTLSNFTIENSTDDIRDGWWKAGIRIAASNVIIEHNIIQQNLLGIFVKHAEHLTIRDNWFYNDSITIYPYDTNYSTRPQLERSHYIHDMTNNVVNGKPLLYYVDISDCVISSEVGQLILVNCTNVTVQDIIISSADFPVLFVFCTACTIQNSSFFDNEGECTLLDSDQNIICHNQFFNNFHGLLLDYGSSNNQIHHNSFDHNQFCGVVCEYHSNENQIFYNDFLNNQNRNAFFIRAYKNRWNENYWSDWIWAESPFQTIAPKIIIGTVFEWYQYIPSLFNIDLHPRQEPLDVS